MVNETSATAASDSPTTLRRCMRYFGVGTTIKIYGNLPESVAPKNPESAEITV
jgi:hypothetical protein